MLAAVLDYAYLSNKKISNLKVVIAGAGAADLRIAQTLKNEGVEDLIICDSKGILSYNRSGLHLYKQHAIETKNNYKKLLSELIYLSAYLHPIS